MRKSNNKRRRRYTRRDILIILIPTVAAIAVVLIAFFVADHGSSYKLRAAASQYYAGSVAQVPAGMELTMYENGVVTFDTGAGEKMETSLPLYLNEERTIVLTTDMIYYMPRTRGYGKAAALSEINHTENGVIKVKKDGKTVKPEAGFLYDGKDFYLFLEPVIVSFMGYSIELPPLSYAEVIYGGNIMLFNYDTKEFTIEALSGTATAATRFGDYTISLVGDSMTNIQDEMMLLMTKPENLEILQ